MGAEQSNENAQQQADQDEVSRGGQSNREILVQKTSLDISAVHQMQSARSQVSFGDLDVSRISAAPNNSRKD